MLLKRRKKKSLKLCTEVFEVLITLLPYCIKLQISDKSMQVLSLTLKVSQISWCTQEKFATFYFSFLKITLILLFNFFFPNCWLFSPKTTTSPFCSSGYPIHPPSKDSNYRIGMAPHWRCMSKEASAFLANSTLLVALELLLYCLSQG